jgi:FAD/FMN-containing dehydrogenase/Fe-S oxidoreductase
LNALDLQQLSEKLTGSFHFDKIHKTLYATDASVYRMLPVGVAFPKDEQDLKTLITFATEHNVGLIPRTAGTSLAGQCVGPGIVVDVSRHFNQILDLNVERREVRVQPGVVRDELNAFLKPHGLFFGPNTSTSNRCMIGGMVGNNSSGTTSIRYGVTRDKVVGMRIVLSDGSSVQTGKLTPEAFQEKMKGDSLEAKIYSSIFKELRSESVQDEIWEQFPKKEIRRRNTGYAVDALLDTSIFTDNDAPFNLSALLCGSEGTLAFTTEITLSLDALPPSHGAMITPHYHTLEACLEDVVPAMSHELFACELMDKVILDCTKSNREQSENRYFVEGDPAALLMLEVRDSDPDQLNAKVASLLQTLNSSGLSYAAPVLWGSDTSKAENLRKAGLGLLGNMVGDRKAVACIEDTAVSLPDLKYFIGEFGNIMKGYGQQAVYYAHAGAGEIHLRPILDLKKTEDVKLFRNITTDVAHLTKKYKGSFSGEHGDGIVRAEFIPLMIGEKNYELLRRIKSCFDPKGIFNPGKIVDAFPMDKSLRYDTDRQEPEIETLFDFSDSQGILRAAEKCNGSGDCRKSHEMPGAMCPSYQATKNEKDTTRGRANVLRELLTHPAAKNPFNQPELKAAFDLCLSCKACSRECPSNVDVATMKAEFLYQYQKENGYSLRNRLFAYNTRLNALSAKMPSISNRLLSSKIIGGILKRYLGVAKDRRLPSVSSFNFDVFLITLQKNKTVNGPEVALYIDEFTRYLDVEQGKDAMVLLHGLGYKIRLYYAESGRTFISKGFLEQAQKLAFKNAPALEALARSGVPLLGLEPSAILTFRDEYRRLGLPEGTASLISENSFLIEEFLAKEIQRGAINSNQFTKNPKVIKVHNHCYQKALSNQKITSDILSLPENYSVTIIPSGCCGMAGSFGYEKEHFDLSMQIGDLKLFPAIKKSESQVVIAANGTSCRHQIADGTGRTALHPISILKEALIV